MKIKYETAAYEASAGLETQLLPSQMPEIAFSGRSNVGKSSLLNKLLNRKSLARVSSVPGKTVTINFFKSDVCRFVDLPGYGYAKVAHAEKLRWASLMESYFTDGRDIRLVIQLIDMRHEPSAEDVEMLDFLSSAGIPFAVALTKCDKLNKTQRSELLLKHCQLLTGYGAIPVVVFSALTGEGTQELRNLCESALDG